MSLSIIARDAIFHNMNFCVRSSILRTSKIDSVSADIFVRGNKRAHANCLTETVSFNDYFFSICSIAITFQLTRRLYV